jgi:hypothetical protein
MHSTATERAKYTKVWTNDEYRVRSPGLRHLAGAIEWMRPDLGATFTDWGAGSGQAAHELARLGYVTRLVDIAVNAYRGPLPFVEACLWDLPADLGATDYGFCADVMEHLPPDKVETVFNQIAARTKRAVYFQIALFDDNTFTDAGPLHLSVYPPEWWEQKMRPCFGSVEFKRFKLKHLMAVAKP